MPVLIVFLICVIISNGFFSETLLKRRKKQWNAYFERIQNDNTIGDDINDDSVDLHLKCNSYQQNVINYIENVLKSNLRTLLISRLTYKILQSSKYINCHKSTKAEINRLEKFLSLSDIKFYSNYVLNQTINCQKSETVEKILKKSSLRCILREREILREKVQDKKKWLLICRIFEKEWEKYSETIPTKYLIKYYYNILDVFDKSQNR